MALKAMIVNPKDNVANLIGPGKRGEPVTCTVADSGTETIKLVDDLPSNHKFARHAIKPGDEIIKYGLVIGKASKAIEPGQHVHAHNIESNRGRGDLR